MSFNELGLSAELLRAVEQKGYSIPTPVQRQAIPAILGGKDVMAGAQTGTGKTAGFTLPLLQLLSANKAAGQSENGGRRPVRALVLTPTRELAAQVEQSVKDYGCYLPLKSAAIFGGVNITPQTRALRQGVDILVATPGRLMDHMQQRTVDLSKIEILVLDEADRMLDMGFIPQIRKILAVLPKVRQNLMFSATFSDEIKQLANGILKSPALIEVARRNASAEGITQTVYSVAQSHKRAALSFLIGTNNWKQVLVFARTKHSADRLAKQLSADGLGAAAIHGNKSQGARTRALAEFKSGEVRVLVATDIAARGLDIELLPHVVNFDLPNVPEDYVHRIGRTGRAGSEGQALSLVSPEENKLLRDIEKLLKRELRREVLQGFDMSAARQDSVQADYNERRQNGQRRDNNRKPQNRHRQKEAGGGRAQDRAPRNGSTNNSSAHTGGNGSKNESQSVGRRPPRSGAGNQTSAAHKPAYRPKRTPREMSVLLGG